MFSYLYYGFTPLRHIIAMRIPYVFSSNMRLGYVDF
jgi:hypothetical protein